MRFWRSPPELVRFGGVLQNWCVLEDSSKIGVFWRSPPKLVRSGGVLQNWCVLQESSKIGGFWRRTSGLKKIGGETLVKKTLLTTPPALRDTDPLVSEFERVSIGWPRGRNKG